MFSEKLKCLRIEQRYSQRGLGEKIGMSQRKISYLESGTYEPVLSDIIVICKFFNVSSDWLIGLKEKKSKK